MMRESQTGAIYHTRRVLDTASNGLRRGDGWDATLYALSARGRAESFPDTVGVVVYQKVRDGEIQWSFVTKGEEENALLSPPGAW